MKKSLIALAVAGAITSPAFAATSNVDVYGLISFALEDTDNNFPLGSALNPGTNGDLAVVDRNSRIGFKGSEDLGGGLKAIWQIEQQINATSTAPQGNNTAFGGAGLRNTFIGLSGSEWGTVLMGRHDTPYKLGTKDIWGDSFGDYNNFLAGTGGNAGGTSAVALIDAGQDLRSPQTIAYISPTWSGFNFSAALVTSDNLAGGNLNSGDTIDAQSYMAKYQNGPLFLSGAYQTMELLDSDAWKLGAGYSFGNATIGAIYEDVENFAGSLIGADRDSWLVNGTYTMGNIVFKGQWGSVNTDLGDGDQWTVGADYNFSKRTFAYLIYQSSDNDIIENVDGWALGMKHSF